MDEEATELEEGDPSSPISPSALQLSEWIGFGSGTCSSGGSSPKTMSPGKPRPPGLSEGGGDDLVYVGGLDFSFCTEDPSVGCATLVVLGAVLEESTVVRLEVPYVPGFLAFREVKGAS